MRRLHCGEAEAALIGAVLLRGDAAFDRAAVEPDDVFDLRHRVILEAMTELRTAGHPCGDLQLLADALGEKLDAVGGLAYLSKTTEATVPDHVEEYSRLIRRAGLTRRVQETIAELAQSSLEGTELLAQVLDRIQGLARHVEDPTRAMPAVVDAAMAALGDALKRREEGDTVWGLPTGFEELDRVIGGLQTGKLTILAGRPSMGKSALARSIAAAIVGRNLGGVHVFSAEDTAETYALRQISDEANVPLDRFRTLRLEQKHLGPIGYVARRLRDRHRWLIDDTAGLSTAEIGLRTRKHLSENETRLVVVDHVQLVREADVPPDPRLQMTAISGRLVGIARAYDVAVLALSQLSRDCEKRDDKRPRLADLRESGTLEQDAECVICLYRDDVYNPNTDDAGITECLIRKNKNGPIGAFRMAWDAAHATHRPLTTRTPEPAQQAF